MVRSRSLPYVLPFAVFIGLLALRPRLPLGAAEYPVWLIVLSAALFYSRKVISLRCARPLSSVLLGVAVFAIWVAPDLLWPSYRSHWLFQNVLFGSLQSSLPEDMRGAPWILALRFARAALLVPVLEELFWRAWLMRWIINPDFEKVPLGSYARGAFWITALLFATEHGPLWDVGLAAGIAYNWWIVRTRSLGDCILAHGVTNACLSGFVIATGRWQYW
mgnify:CR=1 FL=1